MSKLKQASEQIKNFAGRIKGLLEAADILGEIGDIDLAAQEAVNRRDAALEEESKMNQVLAYKKGELEVAVSKIDSALQREKVIMDSAFKNASDVANEAKEKAESIINIGRNERGEIEKSMKTLMVSLDALKSEIDSGKKELSEIKKKIEEAKNSVKMFVGS